MISRSANNNKLNWIIFASLSILGVSSGLLFTWLFPSISPFIAPRPDMLFLELAHHPAVWLKAALWTTLMSLLAAIISCLIGILVGFFAAYARLHSIDRWSQLIWSMPIIAIATYLLLVVGNGWLYGLTLAVFLGFYPIEKHTFVYCSTRSEGMNSIAASFSLTKWQEYSRLRLPGSIRSLGAALAQTIPLCFIGETMGEFSIGKISEYSVGLGGMLRFANSSSNYTKLWLSIVLMMSLVFFFGYAAEYIWTVSFPKNNEGDVIQ